MIFQEETMIPFKKEDCLKTIFTENEKQIKSKSGTKIFEHAFKKINHLFGYDVKKLEKGKTTYYYLSNSLETPKIYSDYETARESFLLIVLGLINTTKEKKNFKQRII